MGKSLFRYLPSVDTIKARVDDQSLPESLLTLASRRVMEDLREELLGADQCPYPLEEGKIAGDVVERLVNLQLSKLLSPSLVPVINATGVVVHTNLGRAPLGASIWKRMEEIATRYSNLEYDLEEGSRGSRFTHLERIMTLLTGAEGCVVVNNNAAAVLLVLTAFARGRDVVIPRNELIEIGGSFRLPEIMAQGGARMREVGTTNKVHLKDFEGAIGEDTGLIMKAHWSNYTIEGFTHEVPRSELVALARRSQIPFYEDLGSGLLEDLQLAGLTGEDRVQQVVGEGVDLVSFSGDKMLGGPQAGIVLGRKELVDRLKKHPLTRALRPDKLTLAGLEATAVSYLAGNSRDEIPVMGALFAPSVELAARAEALREMLSRIPGVTASTTPCTSRVGGGSLPSAMLPSMGVTVKVEGLSEVDLERTLRKGSLPILVRSHQGAVLLDVRTLLKGDAAAIAAAVSESSIDSRENRTV